MSRNPITKLTTNEKEKAVNDILTLKKNIDYYYDISNQFESKEKVIQILDELENLIKNNQNPSIKTPERLDCYQYPCDVTGVNGTLPADVNKDGAVDILDVVQIVQIVLLENDNFNDDVSIEEKICIADVNGDGNVDVLDVVQIVQSLLGEDSLECFNCPAGEVELWGECYSIANTTEVSRPNEGLEGEIPERICDLINLERLYLYENRLIGSIPNCMGNMVNLEGDIVLREIDLQGNNLSGTIQSSFCNLLQLNDAIGNPYNNGLIGEGDLVLEENNFCPEDLPWCFQIPEESRPPCPTGLARDECGNCCLNFASDPATCCSPTQGLYGGCFQCPGGSNFNYVCPEQTYLCQEADYQISDWMIDIADDFIDGTQQCNGCGDETALNYNSNAQVDLELIGSFPSDYSTDNPGLCEYQTLLTYGCTDGEACNFYDQGVCTECADLGFGGCTTGPNDLINQQDEPCPNTHDDSCLYDPYECGCGNILFDCGDGSTECHEEDCPQCPEGQTECDNGDCVDDADDCETFEINENFTINYPFTIHANYNLLSVPGYVQGFENNQNTDMLVSNFAKYFTPEGSDTPCLIQVIGEGISATYDSTLGWVGSLEEMGFEVNKGYWFKYAEYSDRPECFENIGTLDETFNDEGVLTTRDVIIDVPFTRVEFDLPNGFNFEDDPFYLSFEEAFAYYPNLSGDAFSLEDIYLGNIGYGTYSNLDNFILGTYGEFTINENEYIPSRLSNTFNEFCTCEFVGAEQCVENYLATGLLSCSDLNWGAPLGEKNWSVVDASETGLADLEGCHAEFVYNETAIKNPYTISFWGNFGDLYITSSDSSKYLNVGLRLSISFKENIITLNGVLGSGEITQHPDCGSAYNPPPETANTCIGAPPVGLGVMGDFTFPEEFNLQQELNKDVSNLVLRCDNEGNKQFFVNGIGSNILENTIPESSDYEKNLAYIDLEDFRAMGDVNEPHPFIRFDELMIYNDVIDISNIYSNGMALNPENSLNLIHWWRMGDGERDSVHDIDEFDFVSLHAISDSAYNSFEPDLVNDPSRIYELNLENPVLYLNDEILSENLIDSSAYRVTFNARVLDYTQPIKLGFASYRDARAP